MPQGSRSPPRTLSSLTSAPLRVGSLVRRPARGADGCVDDSLGKPRSCLRLCVLARKLADPHAARTAVSMTRSASLAHVRALCVLARKLAHPHAAPTAVSMTRSASLAHV